MKITLYGSIIYCLLISAICNKRIDCKQNIYSFEAFYKAYPNRDSIRANDTLYIELVVPTNLRDFNTNQTIDYSGAQNFGPSIQYVRVEGGDLNDPGVIPAANSFENILVLGTEIQSDKPDQLRGFRCSEESGMYKFKVGVVPKEKGLFMISLSDAAGVYRRNNKCDKASFSLTLKDTDTHLYLYEQSRPGYILTDSDRGHLYCFKVY